MNDTETQRQCAPLTPDCLPAIGAFVVGLYISASIGPMSHGMEVPVIHAEKNAQLLRGHDGGVNRLEFSSNGNLLACGTGAYMSPGKILVWDTAVWKLLYSKDTFKNAVLWLRFSPDGHFVAAASLIDPLTVYEAKTGVEHLRILSKGSRSFMEPSLADFSTDSRRLFVTQSFNGLAIWDLRTKDRSDSGALPWNAASDCVSYSAAWSPNGKHLAVGGNDKVAVWDPSSTGSEMKALDCHGAAIFLRFSPEGRSLVSVVQSPRAGAYQVKAWDVPTGEEILNSESKGHTLVQFTTDGKQLAVLTASQIELWNLQSRSQSVALCPKHDAQDEIIWDFAISPTDNLLATVTLPTRDVGLWDLKSERKLVVLTGHKSSRLGFGYPASPITFDRQGERLAVGAGEDVVIWNVHDIRDQFQEEVSN